MFGKLRWILLLFPFFLSLGNAWAQLHPQEAVGRIVFDSFRYNNFKPFFERSIFALNEEEFKSFLYGIRNQSIRNELIALHRQPFPDDLITASSKWEIAFKHNWRGQWRHLSRNSPDFVREQSFLPILREARGYQIQWETVKLMAIEVLLPVSWKNGRFEVKGDADFDENSSNPRTLHFDRNLSYRLRPDNLTYSKAFMIGYEPEDSEKSYDRNIVGNGSGQGDVVVRFDQSSPDEVHYFCPDQEGAGGNIIIKNYSDFDKPNQRTDLL
ncbi:MAG TPA: hypothetical protein DDY76_06345, partial [Opitutae bacterium]|nr:hypothetical protein [Opitutae bacterium]